MTIGRFFLVMFAGFAACFAAGVGLTVAALTPQWSGLAIDAFGNNAVNYLVAFGALFVSLAAFLPTIVVIALGEILRVRSALFYAAAFCAVAVFTYFSVTGWDTLPLRVDGFRRRELELMAASGILAGFVYWAIAGRSAGGITNSSNTE